VHTLGVGRVVCIHFWCETVWLYIMNKLVPYEDEEVNEEGLNRFDPLSIFGDYGDKEILGFEDDGDEELVGFKELEEALVPLSF